LTVDVSPTLQRVVKGQLCTGCGLCAAVSGGAIEMSSSAEGFNRPRQLAPLGSANETVIAEACPGAIVASWPSAPRLHPVWGPYHAVYTGHAVDADLRFKGSSGGAVTALAVHALNSGVVDRVIHVVANPDDPAGNLVRCSSSAAEVIEGAGSRYVSSSPLADIEKVLADGGSAAFIGKPCDVSALRRLALVDPRVDAHIPLMLAFFCAGIPSRRAVGRVLDALGVAPGDLAAFRYRGNGWPGKATATAKDGRVAQMSYEESWGDFLSKDVQFRCKICPDAVGGTADIACADAWYGGETGYPTFEELDGRSLIVSRTARGQSVLDAAVAAGDVAIEPLALGEIDLMQPSQAHRKRLVRGRLAALAVTFQPRPRVEGLSIAAASKGEGLKEQLRNFLGTLRRIVLRRR
jgi:coenzyme F420 hydrogenase subunit beta